MPHESEGEARVNPCEDLEVDPQPGPGGNRGGGSDPEDGDEPQAPPEAARPERQQEPWGEPARNMEENNQNPDPGQFDRNPRNAQSDRIPYASAAREVTSMSTFNYVSLDRLLSNSIFTQRYANLAPYQISRVRQENNTFMRGQTSPVDRFRDSLLNFWTSGPTAGELVEAIGRPIRGNRDINPRQISDLNLKNDKETLFYSPIGPARTRDQRLHLGRRPSDVNFQNYQSWGLSAPIIIDEEIGQNYAIDPELSYRADATPSAKREIFRFKIRSEVYERATIGATIEKADNFRRPPPRNEEMLMLDRAIFCDIFVHGENSNSWAQWSARRRAEGRDHPDLDAEAIDFYKDGLFRDRPGLAGRSLAPYLDYTFDAPAAFFEKEMNNILLSPSHTADIEAKVGNVYFFEEEEREVSELAIPNVYSFYQAMETIRNLSYPTREGVREPEDNLNNVEAGALAQANIIENSYTNLNPDDLYSTPRVLKFPSKQVQKFKEISQMIFREQQTSFGGIPSDGLGEPETLPIAPENYVKIKINSSQAGIISEFLNSNNMDLAVLEFLDEHEEYENAQPQSSARILDDRFISNDLNPETEGVVDVTNNDIARENVTSTFYNHFENRCLNGFIEKVSTGDIDLKKYPLYYPNWDQQQLLFFDAFIQKHILMDQLNGFVAETGTQRSFADILNGEKAYSEVIGYKVIKYKMVEGQGPERELVQVFYFMDSNEITELEYIDSQIAPGATYEYEIYTINFVLATKYHYVCEDNSYNWISGGKHKLSDVGQYQLRGAAGEEDTIFRMDINVESDIEYTIIEAPFFKKTIRAIDHHPLPPQITWLPYQNIDDKIGILFNINYGEEKENRISIFGDSGVYEEGYPVHFKTDSLPYGFEVLRIDHAPESYKDFATADDEPYGFSFVKATGKTGFILQDIEPNKYYYYTFRTYDIPNSNVIDQARDGWLRSNPTEVYRIRIVSYDNGIFAEIETYEMHTKPKEYKKDFEHILKIQPAFNQKMINFEQVFETIRRVDQESAIGKLREELGLLTPKDTFAFKSRAPELDRVQLGPSEEVERLWGRKFKFRIKSKPTGRSIDLNIKFTRG